MRNENLLRIRGTAQTLPGAGSKMTGQLDCECKCESAWKEQRPDYRLFFNNRRAGFSELKHQTEQTSLPIAINVVATTNHYPS